MSGRRDSKVDRLKAVSTQIWMRRFSDAFYKESTYKDRIKKLVLSTERILTRMGIKPHQYGEIYEISLDIYNKEYKNRGPYNIDVIISAANKFLDKPVKEKVFDPISFDCLECRDTGLKMEGLTPKLIQTGRLVKYELCECQNEEVIP